MTVSFLKRNTPECCISLDAVALNCVTSMKLLGVTVQNNLKWDIHVAEIVTKASRKLSDMLAVYTCYVRPTLEYACQVWHSFNH